MVWPAESEIDTTNCDSNSDNPALFRPNIKRALDAVKAMISSRNQSGGVAGVGSDARIAKDQAPEDTVYSNDSRLNVIDVTCDGQAATANRRLSGIGLADDANSGVVRTGVGTYVLTLKHEFPNWQNTLPLTQAVHPFSAIGSGAVFNSSTEISVVTTNVDNSPTTPLDALKFVVSATSYPS